MKRLPQLFENNRDWAAEQQKKDPQFFTKLSEGQNPDYLWIGCSDSRVPANAIVGLSPGDLFVHRNIANVVVHSDLNCQSVIQYAIEALHVKHVIVCGHYGCGGVKAAMGKNEFGLIDNWLNHIREHIRRNARLLEDIQDEKERLDKMCELNVKAQVLNVCQNPFVEKAWDAGKDLTIHGWIYNLKNGQLNDLDLCIDGPGEIPDYR